MQPQSAPPAFSNRTHSGRATATLLRPAWPRAHHISLFRSARPALEALLPKTISYVLAATTNDSALKSDIRFTRGLEKPASTKRACVSSCE